VVVRENDQAYWEKIYRVNWEKPEELTDTGHHTGRVTNITICAVFVKSATPRGFGATVPDKNGITYTYIITIRLLKQHFLAYNK